MFCSLGRTPGEGLGNTNESKRMKVFWFKKRSLQKKKPSCGFCVVNIFLSFVDRCIFRLKRGAGRERGYPQHVEAAAIPRKDLRPHLGLAPAELCSCAHWPFARGWPRSHASRVRSGGPDPHVGVTGRRAPLRLRGSFSGACIARLGARSLSLLLPCACAPALFLAPCCSGFGLLLSD